jgi:ribosomal protein S18 acetylase RimI-like enzyme
MANYVIRQATLGDIDFIVKSIIEAEKSGSDKLSYSTVFNISEEEVRRILHLILSEEIDGCEFSLSNYLVAEFENKVVATIGAWVETKAKTSYMVKSNLLSYYLPKKSILYAANYAKIVSELAIEHLIDALSLVVVYISPEHRGRNLLDLIVREHIKRNAGVRELAVQVMSNNSYAIRSYERYGFKTLLVKRLEDERILNFLPYNEKILMNKLINL